MKLEDSVKKLDFLVQTLISCRAKLRDNGIQLYDHPYFIFGTQAFELYRPALRDFETVFSNKDSAIRSFEMHLPAMTISFYCSKSILADQTMVNIGGWDATMSVSSSATIYTPYFRDDFEADKFMQWAKENKAKIKISE